jgi:hypothetical protein
MAFNPKDPAAGYNGGTPTAAYNVPVAKDGTPTAAYDIPDNEAIRALRPTDDFSAAGTREKRNQLYRDTAKKSFELRAAARAGTTLEGYPLPVTPIENRNMVGTPAMDQPAISKWYMSEADRLMEMWDDANEMLSQYHPALVQAVNNARKEGVYLSSAEMRGLGTYSQIDAPANRYIELMQQSGGGKAGATQAMRNVYLTLKKDNPKLAAIFPEYVAAKLEEIATEAAKDPTAIKGLMTKGGEWAGSALGVLAWFGDQATHASRAYGYDPSTSTNPESPNYSPVGAQDSGAIGDFFRGVMSIPFNWDDTDKGDFNQTMIDDLKREYPPAVIDAAMTVAQAGAEGKPDKVMDLWATSQDEEVLNLLGDIFEGGPRQSNFDLDELVRKIEEANVGSLGPMMGKAVFGDNFSGSRGREIASDVMNVGATLALDPINYAFPFARAVTATRYAILKIAPEAAAGSVSKALKSTKVAGLETNRARRYFEGFLRELDRMEDMRIGSWQAARQDARIARQYKWIPSDVADFFAKSVSRVDGKRYIDDIPEGKAGVSLVDAIENSNDMWRARAGEIGESAREVYTNYAINRAMDLKLIDEATPEALEAAVEAGVLPKEIMTGALGAARNYTDSNMPKSIADRVAKGDKRGMTMPYTGVLADLRRRTVNATVLGQMNTTRTQAVVDRFMRDVETPGDLANMLETEYKTFGATSRRIAPWGDTLPGRKGEIADEVSRLFSTMPDLRQGLDISTGSNAIQLYKFARQFYSRDISALIFHNFRMADEKTRRLIAAATVRSGAAAAGVDLSKAEAMARVDALVTTGMKGERYSLETPGMPSALMMDANLKSGLAAEVSIKESEAAIAKAEKLLAEADEQTLLLLDEGVSPAEISRSLAAAKDEIKKQQANVVVQRDRVRRMRAAIYKALDEEDLQRASPLFDEIPVAIRDSPAVAITEPATVVDDVVDEVVGGVPTPSVAADSKASIKTPVTWQEVMNGSKNPTPHDIFVLPEKPVKPGTKGAQVWFRKDVWRGEPSGYSASIGKTPEESPISGDSNISWNESGQIKSRGSGTGNWERDRANELALKKAIYDASKKYDLPIPEELTDPYAFLPRPMSRSEAWDDLGGFDSAIGDEERAVVIEQLAKEHPEWVEPKVRPSREKPGPDDPKPIDIFRNHDDPDFVWYPFREGPYGKLVVVDEPHANAIPSAKARFKEVVKAWEKISPLRRDTDFLRWVDEQKFAFGNDFNEARARELYDVRVRGAKIPKVESVRDSTPTFVEITDAMGRAVSEGNDSLALALHDELEALAPQVNKQWAEYVLSDPKRVDDFLASVGLKQGEESPEWVAQLNKQWEERGGYSIEGMEPLPASLRVAESLDEFMVKQGNAGVYYESDEALQAAYAKSILSDDAAERAYLDWYGFGKETPEAKEEIAKQIRANNDGVAVADGFGAEGADGVTSDPDIPEKITVRASKTGLESERTNPAWSDWKKNGLITPRQLRLMAERRGSDSVWSWWNTGTWDSYYNEGFFDKYGPTPVFEDGGKSVPGEYMGDHAATYGKNIKKLRPPFFKTNDEIENEVSSYIGNEEFSELKAVRAGQRPDELEKFLGSLRTRADMTSLILKRDAWVAEQIDLARYRLIESAAQGSDVSPLLAYYSKLQNQAKQIAAKSDLPDLPQVLISDLDQNIPQWFKDRNGSLNYSGFQEEVGDYVYSVETARQGISVKMWRKGYQKAWNKKEGDVWSIGMPNASVIWRDGGWVKGGGRMNLDKAPLQKDLDQVTEYAKKLEGRYNIEPYKEGYYGQVENPALDLQRRIANGELSFADDAAAPTTVPATGATPVPEATAPSAGAVVDETVPVLTTPTTAPVAAPAKVVDPNVYQVTSMEGVQAKVDDYMTRIRNPIQVGEDAVRWSPSVDELGRESAIHLYQTTRRISLPDLREIEAIRKFRANPLGSALSTTAQRTTDIWSLGTLFGPRFSQRSAIEDILSFFLTDGIFHIGDLQKGRRASTAQRDATADLKIVEKSPGAKTELPEYEITSKSRLGMFAKRSRRLGTWINEQEWAQNQMWMKDLLTPNVDPKRIAIATAAQESGNSMPMYELLGDVMVRQKVSGLNEVEDGVRGLSPEGRDIQDLMSSHTGQVMLYNLAEDGSTAQSGQLSKIKTGDEAFDDYPDVELARIKQPVSYGEFKNIGLSAKEDANPRANEIWHRRLQTIVNDDGPIGKVFVVYAFQPEKAKAAIAKAVREDTSYGYKERYSLISDDASIEQFASRYYEGSLPYFLRSDRTPNLELRKKFITYSDVDGQGTLLGDGSRRVDVQWRTTDSKGRDRPIVSVQDLKAMDTKDKPEYVLGREQANIPTAKNEKAMFLDRAWNWMGAQYARIAREPIYYANYLANRRVLRPREDALVKMFSNGRQADEIDEMIARGIVDRQAQDASYAFTLSYMDNPNNRSILAYKIRNFSRYYRATEDFARRAGRLAQNYPDAYYKLAITYQVLDDTGFTYRDSNGDVYFAYPGNQILQDVMSTVFGGFGGGGMGLGSILDPFTVGGRLKSIAPSTDPMAWLPTASGPMATIPLATLFNFAPQLQGLRSMTLGEYSTAGQDGSILGDYAKAIMPASVQKIWNAMDSGEQDSAMASSVAGAVSIMAANGQIDATQGTEMFKTTEEYALAQRLSVGLFLSKLLMGFTVPASPQVYQNNIGDAARNMGIDGASDLWNYLTRKYPNDLPRAYTEWARLDTTGALLPFTVSKTKTNDEILATIPGFQPYKGVVDWYRTDGEELSGKYPTAYMFMAPVPEDKEFSWDAWAMIKSLGYRVNRTEDELLTEIIAAQPSKVLQETEDAYDAEIAKYDSSTESGRKAINYLEEQKTAETTSLKNSMPTLRDKADSDANRYSENRIVPLFFDVQEMLADMYNESGGNLTGPAADMDAASQTWLAYNEAMAGVNAYTDAGKQQKKMLDAAMWQELDGIGQASPQAANYIRTILKKLKYGSLS